MKQIVGAFRRTSYGTVAALFLLIAVAVALPARDATAAALQYRSLQLSSSTPGDQSIAMPEGGSYAPGTGANGQQVSHTYVFQVPTTGTDINALTFEYCDDPFGYAGTCTLPDGFSAASAPDATVSESTGGSFAGGLTWGTGVSFTVDGTPTDGDLTIVSAAGVSPGSGINNGQFIKVEFVADATNFFVNPDAAYANGVASPNQSQTFFAHLVTYDSETTQDNTTDIDEGTVTSSIANTVSINTRVQETLKFSVGGEGGSADDPSSAANAPTAACVALDTTGALTMGDTNQALSTAATATAKSYARVSTNSSRGTKILYSGRTLISTAGDNIDEAGATSVAFSNGTERFGLGVLDSNAGANEGYTQLAPTTEYDYTTTSNEQYAFDDASDTVPIVIAQSSGIIDCDTLPIGYAATISNQTPAGLYSTKISYIAVPSY